VWEKDLSDGPSPAERLAHNLKELEVEVEIVLGRTAESRRETI
jgi:hypothetical protein